MDSANVWSVLARPHRWVASGWPWRSLAYLLSGVSTGAGLLSLLLAGVLVGVLTAPLGVGVGLLLGLALVGIPVGALERGRLRLMGGARLADPHLPAPAAGIRAWLRVRLREQATWRELGYVFLHAAPLLLLDLLLAGNLISGSVVLLLAPLLVRPGEQLPFFDIMIYTTGQVWLAVAAGVVFTLAGGYLLTGYAAARAALARLLLGPRERELERSMAQVVDSRARLARAFDAERRRIERDLHDGAQQHLLGLAATIGLARHQAAQLPESAPLSHRLDLAAEQVTGALAALRETVRDIYPSVLGDRGLPAALAAAADRSPLPVTLDLELPHRLPPAVEATAYFAGCELLGNAAEHSGACRVRISGRFADGRLRIEVSDDGAGGAALPGPVLPDPAPDGPAPGGRARPDGPAPDGARGTGLVGIADRLAVHDGRLLISSPAGGPTRVTLEIPCREVRR